MTPVTFLVEMRVDQPDPSTLITLAQDIQDKLEDIGEVLSVRPYARPSLGLTPELIQQSIPSPQPNNLPAPTPSL